MPWYDNDDLWIALAPTMRGPEALEAAEAEVDQMVELLGIAPGTCVLDLGSGPGRHALALARRGYDVTAVDRTPNYLTHIAAAGRRMGVVVEVVRRDLRDFRRPAAFDAIICSDAFGLFDTEDDDSRVLANALHSLVPGGCLLISTRGKEAASRGISPKDWQWLRPGVLCLEEREIDANAERLNRRLSVVEAGRIRKFQMSERLYAGSELRRLIHAAGFSSCSVFGGLDGRALADSPNRLVALAEK